MKNDEAYRVRGMMSDWKHKWFGFWNLTGRDDLPYPRACDVIDVTFAPEDKPRLIKYLRNCPVVASKMIAHKGKCDFCEKQLVLSTFQSDGVWLWPSSLVHFVEDHSAALPDRFIEHMRMRSHTPCDLDTTIDIRQLDWPPLE